MHPRDVEHPEPIYTADNGLRIRWLGTAGFELSSPEGPVLLIDPYVTRVGLWTYLTRRIVPNERLIAEAITSADGVLVGHSHFDHVMDVPIIASRTGAHVYGSRSTANLMQASGLPESQWTALSKDERTTFEVGPFRVTAVPSRHSRFAFGKKVPYPGDIPCSCEIHLKGSGYRCGDVFSFLIDYNGFRLYHLGSADLVEDVVPAEARGVDLLLMCIAARFATERFIPRSLMTLAPVAVMPMHYDFMWRSADKPMRLLPRTDFGRLVDDVQGFSREMSVLTLPLQLRTPVRSGIEASR